MKKQIINIAIIATLFAAMAQTAMAGPRIPTVPDAGSTSLLMALAVGGLATIRRYVR